MNRKKTKFKYLMNIWKSSPTYPTIEDVRYEISSYLFKEGKADVGFSFITLNSLFGKNWQETSYFNIIQDMIASKEIIELDKKSNGNQWYKLNKIV